MSNATLAYMSDNWSNNRKKLHNLWNSGMEGVHYKRIDKAGWQFLDSELIRLEAAGNDAGVEWVLRQAQMFHDMEHGLSVIGLCDRLREIRMS